MQWVFSGKTSWRGDGPGSTETKLGRGRWGLGEGDDMWTVVWYSQKRRLAKLGAGREAPGVSSAPVGRFEDTERGH